VLDVEDVPEHIKQAAAAAARSGAPSTWLATPWTSSSAP
jgi:hypothetical protein